MRGADKYLSNREGAEVVWTGGELGKLHGEGGSRGIVKKNWIR